MSSSSSGLTVRPENDMPGVSSTTRGAPNAPVQSPEPPAPELEPPFDDPPLEEPPVGEPPFDVPPLEVPPFEFVPPLDVPPLVGEPPVEPPSPSPLESSPPHPVANAKSTTNPRAPQPNSSTRFTINDPHYSGPSLPSKLTGEFRLAFCGLTRIQHSVGLRVRSRNREEDSCTWGRWKKAPIPPR
jgi:hypothetical protein